MKFNRSEVIVRLIVRIFNRTNDHFAHTLFGNRLDGRREGVLPSSHRRSEWLWGDRSVNRSVVFNPPMKVIVRLGVPLYESERLAYAF